MALNFGHLNEVWGDPISLAPQELNTPLGPVCTDSRHLEKGNFFIPLQGEHFDGHDFLQHIFNNGAQAAVISKSSSLDIPKGLIHWIVEDTLQAYQQIALLHRIHLDIPVIAVTGSVGKTTTRELIKALLTSLGPVMATTANNNNDVGVPLTLLAANRSHEAIVVEMGMRGLGEIERLSYCSRPDIAVITNIGSAHIGLLGSRENIAKAKCEITSHLRASGLVIIPAGDHLLEDELSKSWNGRVVRVGLNDDVSRQDLVREKNYITSLPAPDYLADFIQADSVLNMDGINIQMPLYGRHNALNYLLAVAVARELGVFDKELKSEVKLPSGRHGYIKIGGITVIDETYNASPESVKAALDSLVTMPGRHFAVLGAMLELGEKSLDMHRSIAKYALKVGLDGLVVFGDSDDVLSMSLVSPSMHNFAIVSTPKEACHTLKTWLVNGDVLLLKASRGVALERIIPLLEESHLFMFE